MVRHSFDFVMVRAVTPAVSLIKEYSLSPRESLNLQLSPSLWPIPYFLSRQWQEHFHHAYAANANSQGLKLTINCIALFRR